jgi:hypothetical protein
MCSGEGDRTFNSCRVSPFGNPRITARLTAPRGLSQPPTSFIGSWCQGIHRAPLITWPQRCSRPLCSSQGTGGIRILVRRVPGCPGRSTADPSLFAATAPLQGAQWRRPEVRVIQAFPPGPSGPNSVPRQTIRDPSHVPAASSCTSETAPGACQLVNVPPLSTIPGTCVRGMALDDRLESRSPGAP